MHGYIVRNWWSAVTFDLRKQFSCQGRKRKIFCWGVTLLSEPQIWTFYIIICQTMSKNCVFKVGFSKGCVFEVRVFKVCVFKVCIFEVCVFETPRKIAAKTIYYTCSIIAFPHSTNIIIDLWHCCFTIAQWKSMSKLYSEGCGFNSYLEALIFLLHSPVCHVS